MIIENPKKCHLFCLPDFWEMQVQFENAKVLGTYAEFWYENKFLVMSFRQIDLSIRGIIDDFVKTMNEEQNQNREQNSYRKSTSIIITSILKKAREVVPEIPTETFSQIALIEEEVQKFQPKSDKIQIKYFRPLPHLSKIRVGKFSNFSEESDEVIG